MCMKYVNANISLFKEVKEDANDIISFSNPFATINLLNGKIEHFSILSNITLMGSYEKKAGNVLDLLGKLEVCIRLTKCSENKNERISYDLDKFILDTQDPTNVVHYEACVPYLNYRRITNIGEIEIGADSFKGKYVIKILVKDPRDEKYTVQTLTFLEIK